MRVFVLVGFAGIVFGGEPALLRVVYNDDLHGAQQLLLAYARVNEANDLGATPLWAACQNGNLEMVSVLLRAGANPNVALLSGETPLMVAARGGNTAIVERLLRAGANPNAAGTRRQTALMWAVAQRHADTVRALLKGGADWRLRTERWEEVMAVPPHGYLPYNKAIPHGSDTALLFAARVGDAVSARMLLEAGADVNDADAWGVSALAYAAHSGFGDLVELLLARGADPNAAGAGFAPLHIAILRRDAGMAAALLAKGANPNAPLRTWTPTRRSSKDLHFAPELVGATPFWLAARYLEPEVLRMLAARGADVRVVHRSETVSDGPFRTRVTESSALLAALGRGGGGAAWVEPDRGERARLVRETVRVLVELGVDRTGALAVAKELGDGEVVRVLEGAATTGSR